MTSSEQFLDPADWESTFAQSGMAWLCTPDLPNSASAVVFYPCPYQALPLAQMLKMQLNMLLVFSFLPLTPIFLSVLFSRQ